MSEVRLSNGTLNYRESGTGPAVVLIHGLYADGTVWDQVIPELGPDRRVIVPDLPLGAHRRAMDPDADLSPAGIATLIAEFIERLELEEPTVVGNDTGGALCQIFAADHPKRVGKLVLTNCDAYKNFLPISFRVLQLFPRIPGGMTVLTRLPKTVGRALFRPLTTEAMPKEQLNRWLGAPIQERGVKRDLGKVLKGITNKETMRAIAALRGSAPPTLLVWGKRDLFFKPRYAERLAADIPGSRLEWIENARTFTPIDAPAELAGHIRAFSAGA